MEGVVPERLVGLLAPPQPQLGGPVAGVVAGAVGAGAGGPRGLAQSGAHLTDCIREVCVCLTPAIQPHLSPNWARGRWDEATRTRLRAPGHFILTIRFGMKALRLSEVVWEVIERELSRAAATNRGS
eukprot:850126-Heterocapsa_arctica.AAC.1